MNPKLTSEQREALRRDRGPIPVEDDETHEIYFLVDKAMLDEVERCAEQAAIRQGVVDLEAGRVITLDDLDTRIQSRIRRPLSA